MKDFNVVLFNGFETLDAFGPVEVIGKLDHLYRIRFFSENGGKITSKQNVAIETEQVSEIASGGILLIPGGKETRQEIENTAFIVAIRNVSVQSDYVLTVCTGSALLAVTGLLNGRRATSNKMAFDWVASQNQDVFWVRKARWTVDGKYYTSSGVSAGIDMALGFVADTLGEEAADKISKGIEYIWNKDKDNDPFAAQA
ncbi:MAG: DJ-1/PfpI family protein [Eubacteriales bacterium]